jgi:hypothetical protein
LASERERRRAELGVPSLLMSMSAVEGGGVFLKAVVERGRVRADPADRRSVEMGRV